MTQAYNLSQFANTVNSSGQASNSGLQNPSVTVTAGTGMSGGGAVALGSSVTLNNAGVTSLTAGTGISVSASTGGVTITNIASGGVTSAVAGNGVAVSGATGAVTFSASCPTAYSVGSYTFGSVLISNYRGGIALINNSNYATGLSANFLVNVYQPSFDGYHTIFYYGEDYAGSVPPQLSGTWKWMCTDTPTYGGSSTVSSMGLFCRVA